MSLLPYSPEEEQALNKFLKTTKNVHERERARALLTLGKGKKRKEVAEIFSVNIGTLDRWKTSFRRLGILGIRNKGYPGNHYQLTRIQKDEIKKLIHSKTPKDLQISEKRFWSLIALKKLVKERSGVTYSSEATYRKLFYYCGFSCHRPGKHNRNQNKQLVERFRVAVKKRSGNTNGWAVWYW